MKILIIEDNQKLAANVKEGLEQEGFAVDCLYDGLIAEKHILINHADYDVVLLDIMLPGKDGVAVCLSWREQDITIPVLMLTARDATDDKVKGLNSGADDYLVKPFAFDELLARLRALLRRPPVTEKAILKVGDITLDPVSHKVKRNSKEIILTLKEYMVLEYLMRHQNKVITRDVLYDHAWDHADNAFSNTVNVHIKNLREKLNDNGKYIQTIRGVGYKVAS
jgi:two-component system, OmpR family, copper resistance phosphate regulon response regulator CusR